MIIVYCDKCECEISRQTCDEISALNECPQAHEIAWSRANLCQDCTFLFQEMVYTWLGLEFPEKKAPLDFRECAAKHTIYAVRKEEEE